MKKTDIRRIVQEELIIALAEQEQEQETPEQNMEIPSDDRFSQAEKAFLGKFAEKGSQYLGILYSKSPSGIEEFINRSADQLNLTMDVFQKLLGDGVIAIEPYGGRGRNEDYTIKLNLDLQGVEQYRGAQPPNGENGGDETADVDTGGDTGGAPIPVPAGGGGDEGGGAEEAPEGGEEAPEGGEEAPEEAPEEIPEPEAPAETILKYGDILNETARTAKRLIEQRNTMSRSDQARVYADKSRMLKRLPKGYLRYLERIIEMLGKRLHNDNEREHLVADILDNMAHNFGLTPRQIMRSYIFYRTQNRLKNVIGEGVLLEQLWPEIAKKIPTKYQKEFESLQHGRSTREALGSFSDEGLQEVGSAFDVFVEKNGKRAVRQRGKLEASLTTLPPETKGPESRTPINESIELDVTAEFGEAKTQSSTLQESVQKLLADYQNNRQQELKQEFPDAKTVDIGIATYSITSTTSKVPSSNPTNEQLQQGRYESMKSAFKEAASALQLPGATTAPEGQKTLGSSGPEYDREKYSLAKRNADPAVRSEYESTYGPHRKSQITVQFDVKIEFKPGIPVVKLGESKEDFIFSIRNKTHDRPKPTKRKVKFKQSKYHPVKNKFKTLPCPDW